MTDYPPGMTLRPIDAWPRAETRARAVTHPDRGADRGQWDRVEAAGAVLRAAGRLA